MSEKLKYYSKSAVAVVASTVVTYSCGLIVIILLNRVMDKDEFGTYAFVVSALMILGIFATAGIDRAILYKFSRVQAEPGVLLGREVVNFGLVTALVSSVTLVLIFCLALYATKPNLDLPNLFFWAVVLALRIPFFSASQAFMAWYQSRQLVVQSVLVTAVDPILQVVLLVVVVVAWPSPEAAAFAILVAAPAPLAIWLVLSRQEGPHRLQRLSSSELIYGLKLMLTSVAYRATQRIDVLMMGILTAGALTADYAVAARLSVLVALGSGWLAPVFTPRIGHLVARRQTREFVREYEQNRLFALALAILGAAFLAAFAPLLLSIIGEYQEAQSVLLILGAAHLIVVGFGANGAYLNMAGHANWSLVSTLTLLVMAGVLTAVLIPIMGGIGAAVGILTSLLAVNVLISLIIWRIDRVPTVTAHLLWIIGFASALLLLAGLGVLAGPLVATALLFLLGILLAYQKGLWLPMVQRILMR